VLKSRRRRTKRRRRRRRRKKRERVERNGLPFSCSFHVLSPFLFSSLFLVQSDDVCLILESSVCAIKKGRESQQCLKGRARIIKH
jgi:hypothetical protein